MPTDPNPAVGRVLLLPPTTRDADAMRTLLGANGIECAVVPSMSALCAIVGEGTLAVVVSEEAVTTDSEQLVSCLRTQPVWSDLPVIVLARSGAETPPLARAVATLGNVSVLERPVRVTTLLSVVRSALRGRARQYEVRDQLAELAMAARALNASEQRYRALATATSNVAYGMSADWSMLLPLDGRGLVKSNAEPIRDWMERNIPRDEHARVHEAIDRATAGKTLFELEHRVVRPDGSAGWTLSRAVPILDESGRIVEWFGAAEDVTARKLAEAALRTSEERLALSIGAGQLGTFYCPMPMGRIEWNDTCKEHFWLPPDAEIDFDLFYSIIHPDDRDRTREAVERAVFEHDKYDIEYRTVASDGRTRWVRAKGRAYYDVAGNPIRFDGITLDVTERRRAEDALRESELRRRLALDSAELGSWHVDPATMKLTTDARFRAIFGTTDEQLGYEAALAVIHPDDRERVGQAVAAAIRPDDPAPYAVEYRVVQPDGSFRWVFAKGRANADGDAASRRIVSFDGTVADVTDRKAAEAERERLLEAERAARAAAEQAGRMKDEFLATLSHELRTPLSAILGWSHILSTGTRSEKDLTDGLRTIERNARAQTQIIEDLLDMSRIISGKVRLDVQRVDLAGVAQEAVATAKPSADAKGIRLQTVLDPHAGPVSGDPARLQQVLWNLLTNAVKFTPKGGRIQVLLERVNSHLELSVSDTGEGIAPEFLPHVFDRFRQADASTTRRHGGLGLGMSIVKQLVELHGGSVRVKSAGVGQGTTFTLSLPLTVIQPEPDPDVERHHPRASSSTPVSLDACVKIGGIKVLVVDDEADARALVRRLLEECEAHVITARSSAEAVELVRTEKPDVLVCDIGMPGEDGYALIKRVRALGPENGGDVPSAALTAYARAEDRVKAVLAGFQMHLAKPVEPAELIATVAGLAGRVKSNGSG